MSSKVPRAPNRTKAFWVEHIKDWRGSGLNKADYCCNHGLRAGSFYNWCSTESLAGDSVKNKGSSLALQHWEGWSLVYVLMQDLTNYCMTPYCMLVDSEKSGIYKRINQDLTP